MVHTQSHCLFVPGPRRRGGAALAQQGGVVTSGEATINNPTPTVTQINQLTDKAIIQWNDFSIAQGSDHLQPAVDVLGSR